MEPAYASSLQQFIFTLDVLSFLWGLNTTFLCASVDNEDAGFDSGIAVPAGVHVLHWCFVNMQTFEPGAGEKEAH